ncbi:MAG: ribose 5-phosphate isomerase B [Bacteroidetes bacterium]|nr:ribose 5-phosphate isomerase B [Bacteroidota bacterium]
MKVKKIGLACDHAGYILKEIIKNKLSLEGYQIVYFGCDTDESCDYPDYAHPLARSLENGEVNYGLSICGSGNGINMVVNKYSSIRSALCWNEELAELARSHNDANVCALPARFINTDTALKTVNVFLSTEFEGGRHKRRIDKIAIK